MKMNDYLRKNSRSEVDLVDCCHVIVEDITPLSSNPSIL